MRCDRRLSPEVFQAHIEQARRRAGLLDHVIGAHGQIWTAKELLELARHARIALDELGQALNYQRGVERRAKRSPK